MTARRRTPEAIPTAGGRATLAVYPRNPNLPRALSINVPPNGWTVENALATAVAFAEESDPFRSPRRRQMAYSIYLAIRHEDRSLLVQDVNERLSGIQRVRDYLSSNR